ncbi:MAG: NAD(P)/FAD-dependent oxidoreductase, partial [Burkholderiales bacterium]
FLLWVFVGDVSRLGLPKPDYKLYESHPVLNTQMLYHIGHGDIAPKPDVAEFSGGSVRFADGSAEDFDLVLLATGYKLHYPFIDKTELNWNGAAPQLYLNCFHPERDNLFVLGMVEAAGLGWEARNLQGELVARFLKACEEGQSGAERLRAMKHAPLQALDGGFRYLKLDRMAYYVHKETYFRELRRHLALFK